ncbi:WRKY transcription factor 55 [Carex littledalei]|uniref:WRKY transcription factor 55 n=1 Tax=Carex littledalei TaxID=544730 RepID=A0A833QQE8_9POAL|nr:WRKY transcription factor 55 [Carex littledalei]
MENSYLDQEAAIREVDRGYDILKQLQVLLQLKSRKGEEVVHIQDLAEPLFREGSQALNHALCIMRSGVSKVGVKSETAVLESVVSSDTNKIIENERGKRRRIGENSWTTDTTMPYDDGHQWRKYGDKKINGTNFSRGYFRCTYNKEQGCEAKKVVQQTSSNDLCLFKVKYINMHTCHFHKTISPSSSLQPSPFCLIEQDCGVNKMPHFQESKPSEPQLLNQGSCLSDAILAETFPNNSLVERNCEWDWDPLLRNLLGFDSDDFLLI